MDVESLETVDPQQLYGIVAELQQVADVLRRAQNEHAEPIVTITSQWVRTLVRVRRLREECFGPGIFADPAWEMLLDLFAARLEGRTVSVSSLCLASAVAPTTALRWMNNLEQKGLLVRHADPRDRRRIHVELTEEAVRKVREVLKAAQLNSVLPM